MNRRKTAVAVIAAGKSSRMGSPKQLIKWQDSTLLQRAINIAIESRAEAVFVVLGSNLETILRSVNLKRAHLVINSNWHTGMGSSIAAATQKASAQGIEQLLITLCDQPSITSTHIDSLIQMAEKTGKGITATGYENNNVGAPALFSKSYFSYLMSLSDDKGAKQLINQNREDVEVIIPNFNLYDIDTPNDITLYRK